MVQFVDVASMSRWMAQEGVAGLIADLVTYLEDDYRRWEQFDKAPRVPAHSEHGVIELMPTADAELYGFKYVNGHPINPSRGLQTVTAFGALSDMATGYPLMLAEMSLLTALRTAATSAMAARHLARPDSRVHALIGTGSQSEFQALGMREVLGLNDLRIWDVDPAAMDKFERNATALGFRVHRAASASDAVAGADVVTTCTADKVNATILTDDMIEPGMHLNAIGGDSPGKTELDPAILLRGDTFVEFHPQTLIEGEIQKLGADHPTTDLWRVVDGQLPGRTSAEQITVFDSVGFAINDFSALRFLRDRVSGTAYATEIDLIAEPADPKDLFSLVALAPAVARR
ncbi:ornithine cyclodeaminase [Demequina capsici]|uniref:Ornithine cyclodeaminase n=1 Tax=Demequina capsici TaxID=3075620 RepID=A0AA96FG11_9MICO|nr:MULTISPECIES: ornithine cyclodeaminase [unclassified Demequina]WNM25020.1 ornithine cyclodeaminase [Demequina sp. OYTSA14]WNM27926.1 ornithine cyclodeaminase [Demequina sp. PMTSA13]